MAPKLCIGMAAIDEPLVWAVVQQLRQDHAEVMDQCEILLVDNNPTSRRSASYKQLLEYWCGDPKRGIGRYVPFPGVPSTAQPRNEVMTNGDAPYRMCIDAHVLPKPAEIAKRGESWVVIKPGSIARLIEFFDAGLDGGNLLQGPLLYDNLDPDGMSTHFTDLWEAEMWGQWRTAWDCPCGNFRFDVHRHPVPGHNRAMFRPLMGGSYSTACPACFKSFPECQFERHEDHLVKAGLRRSHDGDEPFEIPMQGLGLFACRKDAWLGFNKDFSGFGGEEGYIHQKYRNAGKKTLCLPWLRWPHKFGDGADRGYVPKRDDKVRNYVIGFREVGLSLDPVHKHFVEDGGMPEETWQAILDGSYGPATYEQWTAHLAGQKAQQAQPAPQQIAQQTYPPMPAVATTSHASKLRSLAAACERVTSFEMAPGTNTLALAVAGAKSLIAYAFQPNDAVTQQMHAVRGETEIDLRNSHSLAVRIEETDLIFLDTLHNSLHVYGELKRHAEKVRRWIAVFRTHAFGLTGEHGAGMLYGLHKFLGENPEWQAVYHSLEAEGLTILSRQKEDWLPHPVLPVPIAPPQGQQAAPGAPPQQVIQPPAEGPGTELKLILEQVGVKPAEHCDCNARAAEMNMAGVEGVRHRFDYFIAMLRDGSERWGWRDRLAATTRAVVSGLFKDLDSWNPLDPLPTLLRLAIKRAEAKERAAKDQELARAA